MAAGVTREPFRQRAGETIRLCRLAIRLAWQVSPPLVAVTTGVLVVQALLAPLQLLLFRLVLDRAALDLGHATSVDPTAARLPLLVWILASAAVLAIGQVLQPLAGNFQGAAGERLAGGMTERLMLAVSRWQGLARFEDPALADDLDRARRRGMAQCYGSCCEVQSSSR